MRASLFKWSCMKYGKTWEDKYLMYALWSEVVREGGFIIPTIMRMTSYPGHCQYRPAVTHL